MSTEIPSHLYTMSTETPSHLPQTSVPSGTTAGTNGDEQMTAPPSCMFPHHHNILVRNLATLERALVNERRMRRELDMGYTTLIVDIATWTLARLELDYQFRVNNGEPTFSLYLYWYAHTHHLSHCRYMFIDL